MLAGYRVVGHMKKTTKSTISSPTFLSLKIHEARLEASEYRAIMPHSYLSITLPILSAYVVCALSRRIVSRIRGIDIILQTQEVSMVRSRKHCHCLKCFSFSIVAMTHSRLLFPQHHPLSLIASKPLMDELVPSRQLVLLTEYNTIDRSSLSASLPPQTDSSYSVFLIQVRHT